MQSLQMFHSLVTMTGNKSEQLIDINNLYKENLSAQWHNGNRNLCSESISCFHSSVGPSAIEKYLNQHQAPTESWVNKENEEGHSCHHLPQVKASRLLTNGKLCNEHHFDALNYTVKFVKMVRLETGFHLSLPFELNHGRIAGWFWNKCGYWWIVSFSSWWWPEVASNDGRTSVSCFECLLCFFKSFTPSDDSRGDCVSLVIGLVGDGLCFLLIECSFLTSSLPQLKFSFFISISSSLSSTIFNFSFSSFEFSWCFFCCFSLFSSRISQIWKPEVGFVDVGIFMLSRNLWIEKLSISFAIQMEIYRPQSKENWIVVGIFIRCLMKRSSSKILQKGLKSVRDPT